MKTRLNPYKSLPVLACLLAFLTFGCASGERGANGDPDLPEMVEVELQVGVSDASGALQTKASDSDANVLKGEQINSLVVFIVDASGKVEKKFQPDLTEDVQAKNGELSSWSSGSFEISGGVKQIYAFANWESLDDNDLSSAIETKEGEPMSDLLNKTVSFPTNGFDPQNKKYLPMSYFTTWTVSSGKKTIELVRLVSRLQVKVTNATNHSVQLDKLEIGVHNGTTTLFEKSSITSNTLAARKFLPVSESEKITLEAMTDEKISEYPSGWVYVFESDTQESGYTIDFQTTSGENSGHDSNLHRGIRYTVNKKIPRNHIWNLSLWISGYQLNLKLTGKNPPIGGYPEVTTGQEGTALFTLYGGGPFTITIGELTSNENTKVPDITEWKISGITNDNDLLVGDTEANKLTIDSDAKTITGRMVGAATKGASVTFKLEAISNGQTVSIFPITLTFAEIFDLPQSSTP